MSLLAFQNKLEPDETLPQSQGGGRLLQPSNSNEVLLMTNGVESVTLPPHAPLISGPGYIDRATNESASRNVRVAAWKRPQPRPAFVELSPRHLDQITTLEQSSYSAPWSRNLLQGEFQKNVSFRLGIEIGDELLAYCFNHLVVGELHILNLAVNPLYRSRGFGRRLLEEILTQAVDRGADYATLEVRVSNDIARNLYTSLGFELVGVRRRYYCDNGEDALVLDKRPLGEL